MSDDEELYLHYERMYIWAVAVCRALEEDGLDESDLWNVEYEIEEAI